MEPLDCIGHYCVYWYTSNSGRCGCPGKVDDLFKYYFTPYYCSPLRRPYCSAYENCLRISVSLVKSTASNILTLYSIYCWTHIVKVVNYCVYQNVITNRRLLIKKFKTQISIVFSFELIIT